MTAELPADLAAILRRLEESDREAQALIADLDEDGFNWRPAEHSWSVAQCLDHLNVANRVYLEPIRTALELAHERNASRRGPIKPGVLGRWFVRSLEPPPRRRLPRPRKITPAERKSRAEVGEEWTRVQAAIREVVRGAAPWDLNASRFVNPFIPLVRFSVGTGFLVIDAHDRRHVWQAQQVRGNPRFGQPSETSS
jgi:DinB superfamily